MRHMQRSGGVRLDQIEAFVAVAEQGGFAAAGRLLGRDASAVSRRIDALETRLGVKLLSRTTRLVALTEAGALYLDRVRTGLSALAVAESEAMEGAVVPRGLIRISTSLTFARLWVIPWLPGFLERHPLVEVELNHGDQFADLVAGGFDLAIRIGELPDSSLIARHLASFETVLCAAPGYLAEHGAPRRPEDLPSHRCLGLTQPHLWPEWRMRRGVERRSVRVQGQLRFDDGGAMVQAAVDGGGIVLASEWSSCRELADGRLVRVLPDWRYDREGAVQIVRPPGGLLPARTRLFMDRVVQEFTPSPPWAR
ncbi:LysR family transcriptional regulator [Sphingomonas aerophila]|uniref:DNA-binding transcriptional LysR family regulator n=1 Tax=Sphingomonas aerophila TaxID=1344948 RepID=A0A7W9BBI6_9SPHN|nr:LysR family transcriptional regulator [Sphingomonas aerophila]MBB5714136.1 DNA-binding transcriptional LysR family regulator [Sphingomonas aerophila]